MEGRPSNRTGVDAAGLKKLWKRGAHDAAECIHGSPAPLVPKGTEREGCRQTRGHWTQIGGCTDLVTHSVHQPSYLLKKTLKPPTNPDAKITGSHSVQLHPRAQRSPSVHEKQELPSPSTQSCAHRSMSCPQPRQMHTVMYLQNSHSLRSNSGFTYGF